jgi:hypothetical protein
MKKYLIYTVLLFGIYSCSNDNINDDTSESLNTLVFKSALENYDNHVTVYTSGANNIYSNNGDVQTSFNEEFIEFKINEKSFYKEQFSNHAFDITSTSNSSYQDIMNTGVNALIEHVGSTANIYVPKKMLIDESNFDDPISLHFSKSDGKTITWNPDTDNPSDKVFLVIIERQTPFNSSVDKTLNTITLVLPDDGNISISSNDLKNFKIGNNLDIYMARGNEMVIEDTGFVFYNLNLIYGKVVN